MATSNDRIYHLQYSSAQIAAAIGKGPVVQLDDDGRQTWWVWSIADMAYRDTGVVAYLGDINEAKTSASAAETAASRAEAVEAALHARRRVRIGTATDVELLMPGDELIIVDDSSITHTTDYQDLLLEAQKAAAGTTNNLETLAVLSVVNATNLRRTADGLLWTTDTLANFREKLTAFAAAAVAGGYVTTDGECIATWAQAQAWLIEGTLFSPVDAEAKDYTWRKAAPKTEYDAIKERLGSIEAQLGQGAGTINTLITGGTRQ